MEYNIQYTELHMQQKGAKKMQELSIYTKILLIFAISVMFHLRLTLLQRYPDANNTSRDHLTAQTHSSQSMFILALVNDGFKWGLGERGVGVRWRGGWQRLIKREMTDRYIGGMYLHSISTPPPPPPA
jgi:hypothetical protein